MSDILIVDDERDIRELVGDILADEGYAIRLAANAQECLKQIDTQAPALIVLDIWLKDSDMDGIDILTHVKKAHPNIPIIIISGHGNIEIAVNAIKLGAYDFIEKPFNIDQLLVVIRRAMETAQLRTENAALKGEGVEELDVIGTSSTFKQFMSQLDKVAKTNGRVMLMGPVGVGKEVAARYIHAQSDRKHANFVPISATTMDPDTMEEQLFGHESAEQGVVKGLFEAAHEGVIYFDEITSFPLDVQSKILRVLVDQSFTRLGGTQKITVDMRVISASSRDLAADIAAGTFREELFHRLNVVPIDVPGLEKRIDDIPLLAEYFIAKLHEEQSLPLRALSKEAASMLQTMPWPGNVRQLKNVMERVLILGDGTGPILETELPSLEAQATPEGQMLSPAIAAMPLRDARELFEREYLLTQINRFGGNISKTASFVGMERSALHRKLKSLGVVTSHKEGARVATVVEPQDD